MGVQGRWPWRYLTVRVPSIPAWRWPGTEQKYVYLPRFSAALRTLVPPPENVGVLPTVLPLAVCNTTLCGSADALVNVIVTVPAFAAFFVESQASLLPLAASAIDGPSLDRRVLLERPDLHAGCG